MRDRDTPTISIITPAYNSEAYIEEAIKSVLKQGYTDFEHIVVDGGSTDGTHEILEQYPHLNVISEPDDGIYDAVNKGLREATGELIGWLNSDDVYADGAFDKLITKYLKYPDSDLIAGSCEIFRQKEHTKETIEHLEFVHPPSTEEHTVAHGGTRLNGCLLTRELINNVGFFDSSLLIAGDTDYLIRIMALQPNISIITETICRYRAHDESLTFNDSRGFDETTEACMNEAMRFMSQYANSTQIPEPLQDYCLASFRGRSGILFKEYIKHWRFISALRIVVYCVRYDVLWPAWIIKKFIDKYFIKRF